MRPLDRATRASIRVSDVGDVIRSARSVLDAILLDVDNGPEALTRQDNNTLYSLKGLRAARAALRSGGVLGVWSAGPNSGFTRRLDKSNFTVEELRVRANGSRGARHVLWIATSV